MFTTDTSPQDGPQRELIALRQEHSDLDAMIDAAALSAPIDELVVRRLKKKRLALRDKMTRLESALIPDDLA